MGQGRAGQGRIGWISVELSLLYYISEPAKESNKTTEG